MMEPKDEQMPKKVTNLNDERIARKTAFGPMSKFQSKPENRIKHQSVKDEEEKNK